MNEFAAPTTVSLPPWTWDSAAILKHFPKGFTPRPQQIASIEQIARAFMTGKRVVVLEMPTGGGKSFNCMSISRALGADGYASHFLTIQKNLQDQYTKDFPPPEIELAKGRTNYLCTHGDARKDQDCARGVCREEYNRGLIPECIDMQKAAELVEPEPGESTEMAIGRAIYGLELKDPEIHACPYWAQLQRCANNPVALFNYKAFLAQQRLGRFKKRKLLVCDEGHNIESELMGFVSMTLTEWTLGIINVRIDREITTKQEFMAWLRDWQVLERVARALEGMDGKKEDVPEDLRQAEAEAIRELAGKLELFSYYFEQTEWVLETIEYENERRKEVSRKIVARPLFVSSFANDLLFRHGERVLAVSATFLDVETWAESLGLRMDEVAHVEVPCDFPRENRPIHLEYCGNMGFKYFEETKPKFVHKINQILRRHQGQRGIIHSHSNKLTAVLREEIASPRFLFQTDFEEDKDAMIAALQRTRDGVIVAPGMHEGYDLKNDLSRFQVVAKVPYPTTKDKVVEQRMKRDERWYQWQTALKLVQSLGRSVRSKDDWAYSYILDRGFEGFFARGRKMIPSYIRAAFKKYAPTQLRRE
jgi:Rad3-related DNA helicase